MQKNVADEEILMLISAFAQYHPLIRSMMICGKNGISDRSMLPFAKYALKAQVDILRLYILHTKMGVGTIAEIASALQCNLTLEVLALEGCAVTTEGAKSLAAGLKNNRNLRRLSLQRNAIGDDGFAALVQALPHPSLATLNASSNGLTDKSMSWEPLKHLKELHLNDNAISDRGAVKFCGFLIDESCQLNWVSLRNNLLTKKGGGMLKFGLPENAFIDY